MPEIRAMTAADAESVARIHAESWRTAYRGMLRDDYLDGPIEAERRAVWLERFHAQHDDQLGLIASQNDVSLGFVFVYTNHDPQRGAFLESLHVTSASRGQGTGTQLLRALSQALEVRGCREGLYLWAFEANLRTRTYYERLGAVTGERAVTDAPGGGKVAEYLYTWPSLHAFQMGLAR